MCLVFVRARLNKIVCDRARFSIVDLSVVCASCACAHCLTGVRGRSIDLPKEVVELLPQLKFTNSDAEDNKPDEPDDTRTHTTTTLCSHDHIACRVLCWIKLHSSFPVVVVGCDVSDSSLFVFLFISPTMIVFLHNPPYTRCTPATSSPLTLCCTHLRTVIHPTLMRVHAHLPTRSAA